MILTGKIYLVIYMIVPEPNKRQLLSMILLLSTHYIAVIMDTSFYFVLFVVFISIEDDDDDDAQDYFQIHLPLIGTNLRGSFLNIWYQRE